MSIVTPIIAADGNDVRLFCSLHDAERYIEPVDVDVYVLYGADGERLRAWSEEVSDKPSPSNAQVTRKIVRIDSFRPKRYEHRSMMSLLNGFLRLAYNETAQDDVLAFLVRRQGFTI